MRVLTQEVKDKADKKWSFRAGDIGEAEEWMDSTGKQSCSLCKHFKDCIECPLKDSPITCCIPIDNAWKALRNRNIKDFNIACEAVQSRIRSLRVG